MRYHKNSFIFKFGLFIYVVGYDVYKSQIMMMKS